MINLIHFNHKSIHDIVSNKFKMRMSNPRLRKTKERDTRMYIYQCATFVL